MAASGLKIVETGQQKSGKVGSAKKKVRLNNIRSVTWLECKTSVSEEQSFSEAKVDGGLPICKNLPVQIMEQFRIIFLNIKLNVEKSVCAGDKSDNQYWMSVNWSENRCDSVMKFTVTWKSPAVNTFHCTTHKYRLKLYRAEKKPYVNMIQKHHHLLCAKAHLKWSDVK